MPLQPSVETGSIRQTMQPGAAEEARPGAFAVGRRAGGRDTTSWLRVQARRMRPG